MVTELKLQQVWNKRCMLHAEALEGFAKAYRAMLRGRVLCDADGNYSVRTCKWYAEADLLEARACVVRARGWKLWADAIWKTYGDVSVKWSANEDCYIGVNGGEIYIWPSASTTRR
jgi:hypothetical protein